MFYFSMEKNGLAFEIFFADWKYENFLFLITYLKLFITEELFCYILKIKGFERLLF